MGKSVPIDLYIHKHRFKVGSRVRRFLTPRRGVNEPPTSNNVRLYSTPRQFSLYVHVYVCVCVFFSTTLPLSSRPVSTPFSFDESNTCQFIRCATHIRTYTHTHTHETGPIANDSLARCLFWLNSDRKKQGEND